MAGPDTTASLGIEVTVKGAQQATQDLDKLNKAQKDAAQSTKDFSAAQQQAQTGAATAAASQAKLAAGATASAQSMTLFQRVMAGLGGIFGGYGRATDGVASSMNSLAGAHGNAARAMHLVEVASYNAGANLGSLYRYTVLARGGLALLATGLTVGVIVALEKAGDKVDTVKERLSALLGSGAGKKAFDELKTSADRSRSAIDGALEGVEALTRALSAQSNFKTLNSDGSVSSGLPGSSPGAVKSVISQSLQIDKQTAAEAEKAINGYYKAVAKADAFTADVYKQIEHDSPTLAAAISKAWGGDGSLKAQAELEARLQQTPKTMQQFLQVLQQVAPQIQAQYDKIIPNISQRTDQLGTSFAKLFESLGKSSAVTTTIGAIESAIDGFTAKLNSGKGIFETFFTPPQGWGTAFRQSLDLLHAYLENWFKQTIQDAQRWAANIAAIIAGAFSGSQGQNYGANTTGIPSLAGPSFDVSNAGSGLSGSGDLLQFASGGLAQVIGPSGTDKTLVQFMATNGEVVAVGNPSASNSGGSSGVPVSAITQPITAAVGSSTSQIVSAINNSSITAKNGGIGTFSGDVRIAVWKGNPAGTMSDYVPLSQIYANPQSDAQNFGQGTPTPDPTPFITSSDIASAYAGAYANGGSFVVNGRAGTDKNLVSMRVSSGERVSVSRSNAYPDTRPINQHFYMMGPNGQGSIPSPAQIKRAMQSALRR